jgi:hypothetical protein
MLHRLKADTDAFREVLLGTKRAEFRRDDRVPRFAAGDELQLVEIRGGVPTGSTLHVRVTHVVRGPAYDVPAGYAMLSIAKLTVPDLVARVRHYVDVASELAGEAEWCGRCLLWPLVSQPGYDLERDLSGLVAGATDYGQVVVRATMDALSRLVRPVWDCRGSCVAPEPG